MDFKTHNEIDIDINGTHLQGYVHLKYEQLVAAFGQPTEADGYKVDAEWGLRFDDGEIVTIYNWKNGKNYCGPDGLRPEEITEWHVGGHNARASHLALQAVMSHAGKETVE
jgi:hypothetical protein